MIRSRENKVYIITILLSVLLGITNPVYAYIDPGTGSMLFSIILGITATLFFLLNSLFIKLKGLFYKQKQNKQNIPYVIYSEGNQYFCVFKPILDEFEKRKIQVTYYTSSKTDPVFQNNYEYIKSEYIGKGNKAYFKLAFLNANICLLTTPQLDVLQLKKSKNVKHYCHILHSIGFSMDYHLYSLDYYDSVLCDAEFQIPLIREIENKRDIKKKELVVVGSSYMDYYNDKKNSLPKTNNNKPTILVAPSWGKYNLLNKCGEQFIEKLLETNFNVVIRPHPQSMIVEKNLIQKLMQKYENRVSWNFDSDNLQILSKTDILISDFSCILFDFAFLFNKPFIYIDTEFNFDITDIADLNEIPWKYKAADIIGTKINLNNVGNLDINNIVNELSTNTNLYTKIQEAKNYAWMYQGQSASRIVDFLVKKQEELQ